MMDEESEMKRVHDAVERVILRADEFVASHREAAKAMREAAMEMAFFPEGRDGAREAWLTMTGIAFCRMAIAIGMDDEMEIAALAFRCLQLTTDILKIEREQQAVDKKPGNE